MTKKTKVKYEKTFSQSMERLLFKKTNHNKISFPRTNVDNVNNILKFGSTLFTTQI